jgi:predicted negative regulator of RcsB-dependent stress response
MRRIAVTEHISRKELKQDRIKETFEHGAEAVLSHGQFTLIVVSVIVVVALGFGGWRFYKEHKTTEASAALETAMKSFQGRIAPAPEPNEPNEPVFPDDAARLQDAAQKFAVVADKYPSTNPGRLARYYHAICLEDQDHQNQALEELKKLSSGGDKELAAMARYQMAVIYFRTGKFPDAEHAFRELADKPSILVPRSLALFELAGVLRQTNPKEANAIYHQIKKEFTDPTIQDQADRGLEMLSPIS